MNCSFLIKTLVMELCLVGQGTAVRRPSILFIIEIFFPAFSSVLAIFVKVDSAANIFMELGLISLELVVLDVLVSAFSDFLFNISRIISLSSSSASSISPSAS